MDEQQRLLERLPDYLNGHVDGEDARHIDILLENDDAWQAQAAMLTDLRHAVGSELAAMAPDQGLAALRRRINTAPVPSWWQRLLAPPFTMGALASLAAICIAQGWMLSHPHDNAADVAWRNAPISVAAPAANLRVRFTDDATLAQVEAALTGAKARLVSGPQGQHLYLLQADDAAAALVQLRASPAVAEATLAP